MAIPFRRILCPVDFDSNSMAALEVAAYLARQNDATVFLLHVVAVVTTGEVPVEMELYRTLERDAAEELKSIARKRLSGVTHHVQTRIGDPAATILQAAKSLAADLVVMATHGRAGIAHLMLGSVAERVVRRAECPVLTVRSAGAGEGTVAARMTLNPVTAGPEELLSAIDKKMADGHFRSVPILAEGALVGIITDRDLRRHTGFLEHTPARIAMTREVMTVTPETTIWDAARLMREHKIGALPVVKDGRLLGIITTSDLLEALTAQAG